MLHLSLKTLIWRSMRWCAWFWRARTVYQVHSPALYALVHAMLERRDAYYAFEGISQIRAHMRSSDLEIEYHDFGAGPGGRGAKPPRKVKLADLAESSASSERQGEALFRLVHHLQPRTILELGASLGVGAAYLCTPNRQATYVGIEGNEMSASIAQEHLHMLECMRAQVLSGTFEQRLPEALRILQSVDFVYIDGDHRKAQTLAYLEQIRPFLSEKAVIVFDDIYWTPDMHSLFEEVKAFAGVGATLDLFDIGIVLFDPQFREPQHLPIAPASMKPWQKYLSEL